MSDSPTVPDPTSSVIPPEMLNALLGMPQPRSNTNRFNPRWDYIGVPEGYVAERQLTPLDQITDPVARHHTEQGREPVTVSPWEIHGFFNMSPSEQKQAMLDKIAHKRRRLMEHGEDVIRPRYKSDSPLRTFMSLDPASRVQLQRDMAAVGLLQGSYREGVFDSATAKALEQAMGWGNMTGKDYTQSIIDIGRSGVRQQIDEADMEAAPVFPIPTHLAPDYSSLAQQVKQTFRQQLRRDPTDEELAGLADELSSFHRQAYEAEVDRMRHDFYTRQEASEGVIEGGMQGGGGQTVQGVDPDARFQEVFEERFGAAIQAERDEDESLPGVMGLLNGLGVGSSTFGG